MGNTLGYISICYDTKKKNHRKMVVHQMVDNLVVIVNKYYKNYFNQQL